MGLERWPVPDGWHGPIHEYGQQQRAAGAPATTIEARRQHLSHAARGLGTASPWQVTGPQLVSWAAGQRWARETRRGRRSTFRSFWAWGVQSGHVAVSPAAELPRVSPRPPAPRPLPAAELDAAMRRAEPRVRLILRLATEAGLRRGEIARVHSDDLEPDLTGWSLRVHGKGGKQRIVPLSASLALALRALPPGFAFPGREDGHLSARYVGRLAADALPGAWTLHSGRHRFATAAHRACGDLLIVQDLLGHASPATTRAYVAPDGARARAVIEAIAA